MSRVFIIAEAGINHNGNLQLAKELVEKAAIAGADAVKFQTWKTELMVTRSAPQAEYQIENTGIQESQFDMLKKLELTYADFVELKMYCSDLGIIFMSTPDEIPSANFLVDLQEVYKIGSGNVTNLPLLRFIGGLQKRIILSTGMSNMDDIAAAIDVLEKAGTNRSEITILHCTTQYPTSPNDVNLLAMQSIRDTFNVSVGYSDHTLGIEIPIAAAALGANVIEKHFTVSRKLPGPDHKASIEPFELHSMVKAIRNIEAALGDGVKRVTQGENQNSLVARKSIVAIKNIRKGEIFSPLNIGIKRPGSGISPMNWDQVVGQIADQNYSEDELIR